METKNKNKNEQKEREEMEPEVRELPFDSTSNVLGSGVAVV